AVFNSQEATDFIIKDLEEALPDLPSTGPSQETNRASKAAAHFMLAKVYLNKHIYYGSEPNAADMNKVIEHANGVAAEGFELHDGYFEIFAPAVDSETILWTDRSVDTQLWMTLHYFQGREIEGSSGGWNGFSTTAEFYALFEGPDDTNAPGSGQEERRGFVPTDGTGYGFLFGQQYDIDGTPLQTRGGQP